MLRSQRVPSELGRTRFGTSNSLKLWLPPLSLLLYARARPPGGPGGNDRRRRVLRGASASYFSANSSFHENAERRGNFTVNAFSAGDDTMSPIHYFPGRQGWPRHPKHARDTPPEGAETARQKRLVFFAERRRSGRHLNTNKFYSNPFGFGRSPSVCPAGRPPTRKPSRGSS